MFRLRQLYTASIATILTSRCCFTTHITSQYPTSRHPIQPLEDDDFIIEDAPSPSTRVATEGSRVSLASDDMPNETSSALSDLLDDDSSIGSLPPLGVYRERLLQSEETKSRYGHIVKQKTKEELIRDGSRATYLTITGDNGDKSNTATDDYDEDLAPKLDGSLPFDDPEFAERILQMEVDGQLDESWQEGAPAKEEDCKEIVDILKHMKVRNIVCINTKAKTSSFDYMIFGTCEGSRHIHLSSWAISTADTSKVSSKPSRRRSDNTWESVPIGRIVVNLMLEGIRNDLTLERKWAVSKTMDPLDHANAPVSEGRQVKAHGLWSLTLNLQDLEDFEVDYCKDALLSQL